jgi:hypothetical protein
MPVVPFGTINPACRPEPYYRSPGNWDDPTHRPLADLDVGDIREGQRREVLGSRAFRSRVAAPGNRIFIPLVVVLDISAELDLHPYCVECRLLEMGYAPEKPPEPETRKRTAAKGPIAKVAAALAGGKELTVPQIAARTGMTHQQVHDTLRRAITRFRRDNLAPGRVKWSLVPKRRAK